MFPSFSNCILWLDKLLVKARYYCEKSNINLDAWQIEIFKTHKKVTVPRVTEYLAATSRGDAIYSSTSTPPWNNSFRVLYVHTYHTTPPPNIIPWIWQERSAVYSTLSI